MKIINIALNSMFIGLSITCLSGIAFAFCTMIIKLI